MNTQHTELPINLQHNIYVYLHHFFRVSITLSNDYFRPWYYQNYTNLFAFAKTNLFTDYTFFDFCPPSFWDVLYESDCSLRFLKEQKDIFSLIKSSIQEKQYVSIDLDEYYLPIKQAYQKYRLIHPMLIYGYDEKEKELLCIGSGKQDAEDTGVGFLGKYKISYSAFEKAYTSVMDLASSMTTFSFTFGQPVVFFTLKDWSPGGITSEDTKNAAERSLSFFDTACFVEDLQHYIQGTWRAQAPFEMHYKLSASQGSRLVYGTHVLDMIIEYLSFYLLERKDTVLYPFIHLIYEHKKSVYERLIVASKMMGMSKELTDGINEYKKLVNLANGIRFKYLSYHQERSMKDAKELIDKIKILKENEMLLVSSIYAKLSSLV